MRSALSLFLLSFCASTCLAQYAVATYRPLGANQTTAYPRWDSVLQAISEPTAKGNRPVLPGVTGRNLELLQDAVARKYPRVTQGGSLPVARKVLASTPQENVPKLKGAMAEAIFLDKNPEWGYVAKPNASQHDVYAKMPNGGRGIRTGQVKFHISGDASMYARDMVKDYRSGSFLVPDDHVDQLRAYLKTEADRLRAAGDNVGAQARYRDMNRVKGIGASASEIDKATCQAIAEAKIVRAAPYVFVGVATTLLVAPTALDWYQDEISGREAAYRLTKGGSTVVSVFGADRALKLWKGGLLRGTVRGNVIVACVYLMVDTSWQVYEYGGITHALQNPEFLIHLGGDVSATACGLAGGYVGMKVGAIAGGAICTLIPKPEAIPVGAFIGGVVGGVVVGSASGMAGYFGGSQGTRWVMETFCPEKLYEQERAYVQNVRAGIDGSIAALQAM